MQPIRESGMLNSCGVSRASHLHARSFREGECSCRAEKLSCQLMRSAHKTGSGGTSRSPKMRDGKRWNHNRPLTRCRSQGCGSDGTSPSPKGDRSNRTQMDGPISHHFVDRVSACSAGVLGSHVLSLQEIADLRCELITASDGVKAIEQIVGAGTVLFSTCQISNNLSMMHHDDSISKTDSLLH